MVESRVSYRFGKALLQYALEQNELERVHEDMVLIQSVLEESRDLRNCFLSPVIKVDKKRNIFNEIFGSNLHKITNTYFDIIFRRSREELIQDIASSFVKQYKEVKNIHTVIAETASPLSEDNRKRVMEWLKTRTNDKIELVEVINEDLIGGIILKLKDVQVDTSVKNRLEKLEREFSKDLYSIKY